MANPQDLQKTCPAFSSFFFDLKDPRRIFKGNHLHPLEEILFLSIAEVVSGADTWTSTGLFGQARQDWIQKFYPFANRIPSHDVLGRVFAALDPDIQQMFCFMD